MRQSPRPAERRFGDTLPTSDGRNWKKGTRKRRKSACYVHYAGLSCQGELAVHMNAQFTATPQGLAHVGLFAWADEVGSLPQVSMLVLGVLWDTLLAPALLVATAGKLGHPQSISPLAFGSCTALEEKFKRGPYKP
ncbi:hypothetical protein U0070_021172, partial [Myodes glareolus]